MGKGAIANPIPAEHSGAQELYEGSIGWSQNVVAHLQSSELIF